MAGRRPFLNNMDPDKLDGAMEGESRLSYIHPNLRIPMFNDDPPVLTPSGGVDRISFLPHEIQFKILSRLPIKDASRTAVLSSRWREIWLCSPVARFGKIDGRKPFTNFDSELESDLRRLGFDPHKVDRAIEYTLSLIYANLPEFPVYDDRRLPPVLAAPDGVDRISCLPHQIRCRIVSRLPVKDAARTAVLSSRWREIWLCSPVVLIDAHLLPKRQSFCPTLADSPAITAAVSSILQAHPGPFRCVHLVCSHMNKYRPQLACWLQLLATKGVQELVLVNRPWPFDVPLPVAVFSITTLTRLYLGQWKLPDMALLRGVSFYHLRELGICSVFMKHGDVDSLVARSPVLEILNIMGNIMGGNRGIEGLRLRLVSHSLRCVQIRLNKMDDIAVVKAPRLERLILFGALQNASGSCSRVRIGDAPKLHAFGYLAPGQLLEIRDTTIMPGMKVTIGSMLSGVKVLGLNVRFGLRDDVKMVPTFLKCFPNVERLHIKSEKCDKPAGYLNRKFWEKSGPFENVTSRIKEMTIIEFSGEPSAFIFLEFFFHSARVLELACIVLTNQRLAPVSKDVISKVNKIADNAASKKAFVGLMGSSGPVGGQPWNFKFGADLTHRDPFAFAKLVTA